MQHCRALFESLDDLQTHMYEHDDEVEQGATMVKKIKQTSGSLSSENSRSEHAMEDEEDDGNEDVDDGKDFEVNSNTEAMEILPFEEHC